MVVSGYIGLDCQRDLRAGQRLAANGGLRLVALVGRRDALQVNGPLHLALMSLGVFALFYSHPTQYSLVLSGEVFSILFGAVQLSVVLTQVRNQLDRVRLRGDS